MEESPNQNSLNQPSSNTISQQEFEAMRQRYANELLAIRRSVDAMLGRTTSAPPSPSAYTAPPDPGPVVAAMAQPGNLSQALSENPPEMTSAAEMIPALEENMDSGTAQEPQSRPEELLPDMRQDSTLQGDVDEDIQRPEDEEALAPPGAKPAPLTDEATLQVLVTAAQQAYPIPDVLILISRKDPGQPQETLVRVMATDQSGQSPVVTLPAPDRRLTQEPGEYLPYVTYRIAVAAEGYRPQFHGNVAVFGGMSTLLPVELVPLMEEQVPPPSAIGENYTAL